MGKVKGITLHYADLKLTDAPRFYAKLALAADGCIEWQARCGSNGYGVFSWLGSNRQAHRIAWLLHTKQDVPADLLVLHSCDNRKCCNPDHLSLGTETDNNHDRFERDRVSTQRFSAEQVQDILHRYYILKQPSATIIKHYNEGLWDPVAANSIRNIYQGKTWKRLFAAFQAGLK